jgi:hypothetical protein
VIRTRVARRTIRGPAVRAGVLVAGLAMATMVTCAGLAAMPRAVGAAPAAPAAGPAGPAAAPTSTSAPGAASFGFTVRPYAETGSQPRDALDYQLAPGQTIPDKVEVINATAQTESFRLYPAGAYNASGGGLALRLRTDRVTDAAAWITLADDQLTIPARTAAIVALRITVPADAEPGDHTAGVVAEEILPPQTVQHGTGFQTIERVATRAYIRVAGPIAPSLQVRRITVRHQDAMLPYVSGRDTATVTFTVVNSGNVRVAFNRMSVKIAGPLGLLASRVGVVNRGGGLAELPSEVLPGNAVTFRARFSDLPPLVLMGASVSVAGEDPVLRKPITVSETTWFWLVPWLLGLLVLIVVAVLVALSGWRRGRRGRGPGGVGSGHRPPGGDGSATWVEPDLVAAASGPAPSDGSSSTPIDGAGSARTT